MNGQPERPAAADADDEASAAAEEQAAEEAGASATESDQDAALTELKAKVDENWQKYLRAAAELENVRKRAARDVENAHKFALERFAAELLAVRDSLEMGLAAGEEADVESLRQGKEAILKQLVTIMDRFGVEELDPQGEPFDPSLHEAMTMQPSTDVEPGSVLSVFQKGYALNGRLLRPARVVVAAEAGDSATLRAGFAPK
jgi:molecular chaperone GrpE